MRILIDAKTAQGKSHLEGGASRLGTVAPGERLKTFIGILKKDAGASEVRLSSAAPEASLTGEGLADYAVLIVPTRVEPYSPAEIEAVRKFAAGGGGLLLMSNHAPYHEHNIPLAAAFGVRLEGRFYHTPGGFTTIGAACIGKRHPVTRGIREIATNTADSLAGEAGDVIMRFPSDMADRNDKNIDPMGGVFAVALTDMPAGLGSGRAIVLADSGFIGTKGADYPGYGMIHLADNAAFITRAVRWLGGKL